MGSESIRQQSLFCERCGERPAMRGKFLCLECYFNIRPENVASWEKELLALGWELDQKEFLGEQHFKWFPPDTPAELRNGYYDSRAMATRDAYHSFAFQVARNTAENGETRQQGG